MSECCFFIQILLSLGNVFFVLRLLVTNRENSFWGLYNAVYHKSSHYLIGLYNIFLLSFLRFANHATSLRLPFSKGKRNFDEEKFFKSFAFERPAKQGFAAPKQSLGAAKQGFQKQSFWKTGKARLCSSSSEALQKQSFWKWRGEAGGSFGWNNPE